MSRLIVISSFAVLVVSIVWYSGWLLTLVSWLSVLLFGVIGFLLGVSMVLSSGKKYYPPKVNKQPNITTLLFTKMMVKHIFRIVLNEK